MDKNLDKLNQLDKIELLIKAKIISDYYSNKSLWDFIKFGFIAIIVLMSESLLLFIGLIGLCFYFYYKNKKVSKESKEELEKLKESFFDTEPRRKK